VKTTGVQQPLHSLDEEDTSQQVMLSATL